MKIRVTGTKEEIAQARDYYRALENDKGVKYVSISAPYANRGSNTLFRLYVDIEYYDEYLSSVKALTGGTF